MVEESNIKTVATQVIGKMLVDHEFLAVFKNDPMAAVIGVSKNIGKELEQSEIKEIESTVEKVPVPFMTDSQMNYLVDNITKRTDDGYKKVLQMSNVLFIIGIVIIVSTFILDVYGIIYQVNWQTLLASSGVLGGIGILTIYESTNKLPERVKNSVADLVQIKLSSLGYWHQLSILMKIEINNADEAIKIMEKINTATEGTMKNIQTYCETSTQQQKVP